MNIDIFLKEAKKRKIKFTVISGSKLGYTAPKSTVTEKFKKYLDKNKVEIIDALLAQNSSNEPVLFEELTKGYVNEKLLSFGLTKDDILGVNDPALKLDEEELQEIRSCKRLFDIWTNHVYRHKQLKALELAKQKQPEEYDLNATLDSLPFKDKCKFIEHVLTIFKKFFFGKQYAGQKPNIMFIEIWSQANKDLTLKQIFEASALIISEGKEAKKYDNREQFKYLSELSENAAKFREVSNE